MIGRVDVEAHNVADLQLELGSRVTLKVLT